MIKKPIDFILFDLVFFGKSQFWKSNCTCIVFYSGHHLILVGKSHFFDAVSFFLSVPGRRSGGRRILSRMSGTRQRPAPFHGRAAAPQPVLLLESTPLETASRRRHRRRGRRRPYDVRGKNSERISSRWQLIDSNSVDTLFHARRHSAGTAFRRWFGHHRRRCVGWGPKWQPLCAFYPTSPASSATSIRPVSSLSSLQWTPLIVDTPFFSNAMSLERRNETFPTWNRLPFQNNSMMTSIQIV